MGTTAPTRSNTAPPLKVGPRDAEFVIGPAKQSDNLYKEKSGILQRLPCKDIAKIKQQSQELKGETETYKNLQVVCFYHNKQIC